MCCEGVVALSDGFAADEAASFEATTSTTRHLGTKSRVAYVVGLVLGPLVSRRNHRFNLIGTCSFDALSISADLSTIPEVHETSKRPASKSP